MSNEQYPTIGTIHYMGKDYPTTVVGGVQFIKITKAEYEELEDKTGAFIVLDGDDVANASQIIYSGEQTVKDVIGDTSKLAQIGDGTVSDAISSLNNNLSNLILIKKTYWTDKLIQSGKNYYIQDSPSGFFDDINGYTLVSINISSAHPSVTMFGTVTAENRQRNATSGHYDLLIPTYASQNQVTTIYTTLIFIKNI